MRLNFFLFTVILVTTIAVPSRAAEKPRPAQDNSNQPQKVWTNDDVEQLRGMISYFSPSPATAAQATAATSEPASAPVTYKSRLEDPRWYADQAADLQAELDRREAALQQERSALALAADGITQPGVAMDQPTIGVTPDAAIGVLEAQVAEVQTQFDELSDLARQNNIPPGVLRD